MREGLAVGTRRNIHRTLKRALKQAVACGELAANSVEMLDPPKAPAEGPDEEEIRALTDAEARRLFAGYRSGLPNEAPC
jgi:hypothetical protein